MIGSAAGTGWQGPPPREICIVMLSAIGDAVHVLPVANALRRAWPDSRITWVIQPVAHQLVRDHEAIDDFIIFERRRGLKGLRGFRDIARTLKGRHFDLLIGLQVYLKAGVITAMTSADVKLGFDTARARDGQWLFTNRRIPAHAPQHVQDQYFEFLHFLGVEEAPVEWRLTFSEAERERQAAFFRTMERPVCAVVVSTSKREKNWDADGYARVLEEVESTYGMTPVLVGGPSPVERAIANAVLGATTATVIDELGDDLRRLAWILEGSALLISPDTGPLHIGRALGTPVVGLFGHTNPKRSGPYGVGPDLIVDGYANFPGEEYPIMSAYRDGMKRITVDHVLEKVSLAVERHVTG